MNQKRAFAPVQGEYDIKTPSGRVPWAVHLLAYEEYKRQGHGNQSAERLADRGGFGWIELIACLRGEYTTNGIEKARKELSELAANQDDAPIPPTADPSEPQPAPTKKESVASPVDGKGGE